VFVQTGKHLWAWQAEQPEWMFKPSDFLITVMNVSRETIYEKINNRFTNMINAGALDEVRELMKLNLDPALPIMTAHGVPELIKYINGEISLEQATEKAQQNVRNYAKRQLTWIRNQLPHKVMHDLITADDVKKFLNS
jgi:tRNA dimethylallyltransferase